MKIHRTAIADPETSVYYFVMDYAYKMVKAGQLMIYIVFERSPHYLKRHTIDCGNDIFEINGHKLCINNFKFEDTIDKKLLDESEDEDMKRMEHGVYFDKKEYCITASRFYDDETVVAKLKTNNINHDDCIDWVIVSDEEDFTRFSSYNDAYNFLQLHSGLFNSSLVHHVRIMKVKYLPKVEEDENYRFEDGKRLKDSLKENNKDVNEKSSTTASKSKEKKTMTATMKKVKVVPKSEKYTRNDIEQALNEAYDDYGYVLDFIKEDDNYVYIYLKEKEIN